ncbi:MAG: protein tyrosine phosphatase [Caulobacterales bacterium]|nr:protein tyrosine phosphatase [Caulobacterales bacterium]
MHEVASLLPEPEVSDADVAARLGTPWRRFTAHAALHFGDHQFLRVLFQNAHQAGPDMWRTNQPSPKQLERWARRGVRTIVNLRGVSEASFHVLERDACRRLGLELITFRVNSRDAPLAPIPRMAKELFARISYPALMHCKSGADRAGLMSVYYRHFHLGEPVAEAARQLSARYLHLRIGKPGILDAYFEHYLATGGAAGVDLITWSETMFDWHAFKASFEPSRLGDFVVDRVLRRE